MPVGVGRREVITASKFRPCPQFPNAADTTLQALRRGSLLSEIAQHDLNTLANAFGIRSGLRECRTHFSQPPVATARLTRG